MGTTETEVTEDCLPIIINQNIFLVKRVIKNVNQLGMLL